MHPTMKLAWALGSLIAAAQALDVPASCAQVCQPAVNLEQRCDALARDGPIEQAEENQCICADKTVVGTNFPPCLECIRQSAKNPPAFGDDDGPEDAREAEIFLTQCGPVSNVGNSPAGTSVSQGLGAGNTAVPTQSAGNPNRGGPIGDGSTGATQTSGGSLAATSTAVSASSATASPLTAGAAGVQPLAGVAAAGAALVGGLWMMAL